MFLDLSLDKYKTLGKLENWKPVTLKKSFVESKLYTI